MLRIQSNAIFEAAKYHYNKIIGAIFVSICGIMNGMMRINVPESFCTHLVSPLLSAVASLVVPTNPAASCTKTRRKKEAMRQRMRP